MLNEKPPVEPTSSDCRSRGEVGRVAMKSVYVPREQLTESGLCDWIAGALVGQSIQYHEGFLMLDRSESSSTLSTKERQRLHALARRAWIACELGLIHLFSLRVADGHYRYIAVRSRISVFRADARSLLGKPGRGSAALLNPIAH